MKLVILLLAFLPSFAFADMGGVDFGFGPNARPSYSLDYEFVKDGHLPYVDVALGANKDFVQPYVSTGLQFEHINVGVGSAVTMSSYSDGHFQGQITVGPEIGYMQNLTELIYIKENNTYLSDFNGKFTYGATLSIGLNF